MRFTFLTWLFGLICTAFAVAVGFSHVRFLTEAEKRASQTVSARLSDLMDLLVLSENHVAKLEKLEEVSTLGRARAIAEIIRLNPSILQDDDTLQGQCNDLDISELMVTDEEGRTVAALPKRLQEGDISRFDDVELLQECIRNPGREVSLRLTSATTGARTQYACVHRQDAPGCIVVGARPSSEHGDQVALSFMELAADYDLGKGGYIVAFKEGALLGEEIPPFPTADLIALPINKAQRLRLGDAEYFCYAIIRNGYRLVGMMPVSELRHSSMRVLHPVLISNALLFLAIFLLVFYLLQRLVIRNIARINAPLRKMAQGSFGVRIDPAGFPIELRRLSVSINAAVDALQTYGAKYDEDSAREQERARSIRNAILPHAVPPFPQRTEFDISGLCRQTKGVGGGGYDYLLRGEDTLCFLVAQAEGTGMPAALFAQHGMAMVRCMAQRGCAPAEILARVNHALGDEEFGGMGLSLVYGELSISTGALTWVSAGEAHLLRQRKGADFSSMPSTHAPALGRMAGAVFTPCSCTLESGDRLFLYTDSLLEATDTEQEPFGEARLQEALGGAAPGIADVPARVNQAHRKHTRGVDLVADAAMLALEFVGNRHEQCSLSLCAADAASAVEFLEAHLESVFASPVSIDALQQATRCIMAALPADTELELMLDYDEAQAQLELRYPAPARNPLPGLAGLPAGCARYTQTSQGGNLISLRQDLS